MVCDYVDIFGSIPSLPHVREIEFSIYLIHGMAYIPSALPYGI